MAYEEVFSSGRVSGRLNKAAAAFRLGEAIYKKGAARRVVLERVMSTMYDALQDRGAGQMGALIDPEKRNLHTYYEPDVPELTTNAAERIIIASLFYEAEGQWTLTLTVPRGGHSIDVISAALGSKGES